MIRCAYHVYRVLAKFVVLPWLGIAMCILNITSALGAALLYPPPRLSALSMIANIIIPRRVHIKLNCLGGGQFISQY